MHVEEKDHLSEEIVMWKKKHLDMEEANKDLTVEIKRLRRQCEEYKELQDMDADEDLREMSSKSIGVVVGDGGGENDGVVVCDVCVVGVDGGTGCGRAR